MDKGIYFIERYYKDLYSDIKNKRGSKNINKYKDIESYFNRIEEISKKAIHNNKIDLLYNFYYKKYITINDESTKETLKESLKPWLDYLITGDNVTPFWVKYYIFQGMVKIGSFNKEKGTYNKRISNTKAPFIELNKEAVKKLGVELQKYVKDEKMNKNIRLLFKHSNFMCTYLYILNEIKKQEIKDNNGVWIKYNKECLEDAYKLHNSIDGKNTFWCIKDLNCCINEIMGTNTMFPTDFYIYYTKDNKGAFTMPRLAIRATNDSIVEIRGIADFCQNVEFSMLQIVENKLKELDYLPKLDIEYFLKAINDYKELIRLCDKTRNNISFTKEEMDFTYEINEPIYYFSNQYNQRIDYIRKNHIITDKEFLLKAAFRVDDILKYTTDELRNDKEAVSEIIKDRYYHLNLVGDKLKADKEFMLPILKSDPYYIRFASSSIKKDKEIALIILKANLEYFRYMDLSLLKDEDFTKAASNIPGFVKKYILKDNCDIIPNGDLNENR